MVGPSRGGVTMKKAIARVSCVLLSWLAGCRAGNPVAPPGPDWLVLLRPGVTVETVAWAPGDRVLEALDLGQWVVRVRVDDPVRLARQSGIERLVADSGLPAARRTLPVEVSPPRWTGLTASATVADPHWWRMWGYQPWVTNLPALWDRAVDASDIIVAVLDTGVDASHPDLRGRVLPGKSFVAGETADVDRVGHGTHVAGLIAARRGDGVGVAGVSSTVRILPVTVMGAAGGSVFATLEGIRYAVDSGARVLNLSLSTERTDVDPLFTLAIRLARRRGAVVVAAAGNIGGKVTAPANSPGALAIAATRWVGVEELAGFSSRGDGVFMAAPGQDVWSDFPGQRVRALHGTSAAAPAVAGAAASLFAMHPAWSVDQVESALARSAVPMGHGSGHGRLDFSRLQ